MKLGYLASAAALLTSLPAMATVTVSKPFLGTGKLDLSASSSNSFEPSHSLMFTVNSDLKNVSVPDDYQLLLMVFASTPAGSSPVPIAYSYVDAVINCVIDGNILMPCLMPATTNGMTYAYAIDLYNGDLSNGNYGPKVPSPLGGAQVGLLPVDVCKGTASGANPCVNGFPPSLTFAYILVSDEDATFFADAEWPLSLTTAFGAPTNLTSLPPSGKGVPASGSALTLDQVTIPINLSR